MMTGITRLSLAMTAAVLVSGCGGTTKTVLNPGSNGLPYASSGAAVNGSTVTGAYAGLDFLADSAKSTYTKSGSSVSSTAPANSTGAKINFVSATKVNVTVGGTTSLLTRTANATGSFGSETGPLFTDGTTTAIFKFPGNSLFFGYVSEEASSNGTANGDYIDTFVVSGLETNPAELSGLATANYQGPSYMILRTSTGSPAPTSNGNISDNTLHVIQESGSITGTSLNANFGTGAVTGTIQGAVNSDIGNGNDMIFNVVANISSGGNDFSGTIAESGSSTSDLNISGGTGSINGTFYGVNAAEIGGTITATMSGGNLPEPTASASGYFYGSKQ